MCYLQRSTPPRIYCRTSVGIPTSGTEVSRKQKRCPRMSPCRAGTLWALPRIIRIRIIHGCSVHRSLRITFGTSADNPSTDLPRMFRMRKSAEHLRCFRGSSVHGPSADLLRTEARGYSTDFRGTPLVLPWIIRAWIFRGCSVHGTPRMFHGLLRTIRGRCV